MDATSIQIYSYIPYQHLSRIYCNMKFGPVPLPNPPMPQGFFLIPQHPQLMPPLQPTYPRPPLQVHTSASATLQELRDQRDESIHTLSLGPLTNPDDGANIVIEEGGKHCVFTVHRALLCHFSPYFKDLFAELKMATPVKPLKVKAYNYNDELNFDLPRHEHPAEDSEIEVEVRIKLPSPRKLVKIYLPKKLGPIKTTTFAALLQWLYCGFPKHPGPGPQSQITASTFIELWVLASRLKIPALQNDCILGIERVRQLTNVVETGMIEWVYDNTKEFARGQCGLKNLLVDQCSWVLDEKWLLGKEGEKFNETMFPRDCLLDLIARMRFLLREGPRESGMKPLELMEEHKGGDYWVRDARGMSF